MNSVKNEEKVSQNLGLVYACVKRFVGKGIEYDDLYGAGCLGLVKAVNKFDEGRGFQFSTYAVPVILGEIKKLFRDGGSVKVSRSLKELSLKINKVTNQFLQENKKEPTINQLATILEVPCEKVVQALNATHIPLSLSDYDEEDNGQIDIPVETYEEKLTELLSLKQIITQLDEEEKALIELRFFKNKTQTQTAEILNTTQVQISRKEKKILLKMRSKLTV